MSKQERSAVARMRQHYEHELKAERQIKHAYRAAVGQRNEDGQTAEDACRFVQQLQDRIAEQQAIIAAFPETEAIIRENERLQVEVENLGVTQEAVSALRGECAALSSQKQALEMQNAELIQRVKFLENPNNERPKIRALNRRLEEKTKESQAMVNLVNQMRERVREKNMRINHLQEVISGKSPIFIGDLNPEKDDEIVLVIHDVKGGEIRISSEESV